MQLEPQQIQAVLPSLPTIDFAVEYSIDFLWDALPLMRQHAKEVGVVNFNPDLDWWLRDHLLAVTMRVKGELVGYCALEFLCFTLNKTETNALAVGFYISPKFRRGLLTVKNLLAYTEDVARKHGATRLLLGSQPARPLDKLWKFLGAKPFETLYEMPLCLVQQAEISKK